MECGSLLDPQSIFKNHICVFHILLFIVKAECIKSTSCELCFAPQTLALNNDLMNRTLSKQYIAYHISLFKSCVQINSCLDYKPWGFQM